MQKIYFQILKWKFVLKQGYKILELQNLDSVYKRTF